MRGGGFEIQQGAHARVAGVLLCAMGSLAPSRWGGACLVSCGQSWSSSAITMMAELQLVILLLAGAEVRVSVAQDELDVSEISPADVLEQRDVTAGGCTCRRMWSVAVETCDDGDVVYHDCGMPEPCDGEDGDLGYTWCLIDEPRPGCLPAAANWDFCLPGVVEYADSPPQPCSNDDLFAFDCPERVWMFVTTLALLCGGATACGVLGLRSHLRQRRAASTYGSDAIEDISTGPVRPRGGVEPADAEEGVKVSPGLELLGRGVRLEFAPHLVDAVAAQPPSEVIHCGELTQVAVQPLGQVVAPAVLGQQPGTHPAIVLLSFRGLRSIMHGGACCVPQTGSFARNRPRAAKAAISFQRVWRLTASGCNPF